MVWIREVVTGGGNMNGDNVSEIRTKRFPNKVSVTHDGLNYEIDINEEISIDPQNLPAVFSEHPGKFAWYATVHAAAQYVVDQAKLTLDVLRSEVAARLRAITDGKGKKPSEALIASALEGDEQVKDAQRSLIEAKRQEAVLKALREAFTHRRDMLIQLGASEREEKRSY